MPTGIDAVARPLNSHEISKLLFAIIGGVVVADRRAVRRVPDVLDLILVPQMPPHPILVGDAEQRAQASVYSSEPVVNWEVAMLATINGLRSWCDPAVVSTALIWVSGHLDDLYVALGVSLPS